MRRFTRTSSGAHTRTQAMCGTERRTSVAPHPRMSTLPFTARSNTSSAVKIEMVFSSAPHFSILPALPSRMRRMRLFFTCMRPATMSPTSWRTSCSPRASATPSATSLPRLAISWVIAITVMASLLRRARGSRRCPSR